MIINQYLKNELNIDDNSESPNTCSENMYDDYENLNEETYNKEMSELLDYNIRIQSELYLKDDLIHFKTLNCRFSSTEIIV